MMGDWIEVKGAKKAVKEIETWLMIKDPMVARESGIGLTKVVVTDETTIGVGPRCPLFGVVTRCR